MKKRLLLKSLFTIGISIIYAFSQLQLTVSALSPDQKTQQTRGSKYFDVAVDCDTSGGSGGSGGTGSTDGETTDPPKAVQKVIWDTLTGGGIDDIHVAAIMGSIDNEGGFDPMNTGYSPGNYDGKDPTSQKAHDEGYGLIGWTPGEHLLEDMKKLGLKDEKPYTAETQSKVILGYLQKENKTHRYADSDVSRFLGAKTLEAASKAWIGGVGWGFERPGDNGPAEQQDRLNSAQRFLREFGGSTGTGTPTSPGGGSSGCCPTSGSPTGGGTTLTGDSDEEKVFNYFFSTKGLKLVQVAALMGNLSIESGFSPTIYNGNHHTNDPKEADPYAWGLVQWLPPEKVLDEQTSSGVKGKIYDLGVQLDITWWEMKNHAPATGPGFMSGFNQYKNESQLGEAVTHWQKDFEGSLGQADSERLTAAQEIYQKYKDAVPSADSGSSSTTPASGTCSCTDSTASGSGTIVLDPGHSTFSDQSSRNSLTGLYDTDSTGGPNEMHSAWIAANKIKKLLEDKGYNVVLTKKSENESINLSQRAERANKTNGALLFTMHADSSVRWLAYPDSKSSRVPEDSARRDGTNGLVHPDIEKPSKDFAEKMAPIIAKGISKSGDAYDATSFNDYYGADGLTGNGLNPGNTPVQTILSSIPEVYSEVSPTDLPSDDFAKAAADAISTVVKPSGGDSAADSGSGGCVGGAVPGDLLATVKNYAWPNYSHVRTDPVPAFKQAIDKAEAQGQYVGQKYTDCGGFVTRAMIDSGYEPNYNYSGKISKGALNTPIQMEWLQANWQKINPSDTSDLQPGDVAISSSHTFMYVGHIDGFNGDFASASQGTRVPMASSDSLSGYNWYRRK